MVKNSAIRNRCISARGAQVLSAVRHTGWRGAILLSLKYLSSNCVFSTLFYCLTMKFFFTALSLLCLKKPHWFLTLRQIVRLPKIVLFFRILPSLCIKANWIGIRSKRNIWHRGRFFCWIKFPWFYYNYLQLLFYII